MIGKIYPESHLKKCSCSGTFQFYEDDKFKYLIPRCKSCLQPPKLLRVRVSVPGHGRIDFRRNFEGNRFVTISQADSFLVDLQGRVEDGTILGYLRKQNTAKDMFFTTYHLYKYLDAKNLYRGIQKGCSPSYLDDCKNLIKNYLIPAFGGMDIRDIKYLHLNDFLIYYQLPKGKSTSMRQKVKALAILRPILKEAAKCIDGFTVPEFPKLTKSRMIGIDEIPSREMQLKILSAVVNHRGPIEVCCLYPIRPCEVRAIKWKDIDLEKKIVTFKRHFSGSKSELVDGRKSAFDSNDRYHSLSLKVLPRLVQILNSQTRLDEVNGEEFVFKTKKGTPLYESAMRKSWNLACKKLGVKYPMYVGLKHSTMTYYANEVGLTLDQLRFFSMVKQI